MNNQHKVDGLLYASWVWRVITLTNPEELDQYGPFEHIVDGEVDAYEQKALMFLNTVLKDEETREMFINTCSSLVADEAQQILIEWEDGDLNSLEAYSKMLANLSPYLEGC